MGKENVEKSNASCVEVPMAVLVNGSSYSAAEFFAAALREYDWAIVVGEATSGKGHFQVTYQLSDGSAVGLSVGKYFTPKGLCLEGAGQTPDVLVEIKDPNVASAIYAGTLDPMEDPQVLAAIEALKKEN
jgi:carboxyl-terminal processing protease